MRFARSEIRAEAVLVPHMAPRVPASVAPTTPPPPPPPEMPVRSDATIRNWNSAWRSAATAGLVGALLSFLPFGVLLAFPLSGFLSVLFYRRRTWGLELSPSAGFRLGLLAGMLGFATFIVLAALQTVVAHTGAEIRQTMIDNVHRQMARTPDPQTRQILDYFLTPNGLIVMLVVGLIVVCIGFVLLAGLGGAASAWHLRRKREN